MNTKPTYEQLAAALVNMDEAFSELFAQTCSNPVKNAWGKEIDFSKINEHRMLCQNVIHNLRTCGDDRYAYEHLKGEMPPVMLSGRPAPVVEEPKHNLQTYFADRNFNEYNFRDILLRDLVEQEQRRQSKNCSEVEEAHEIQQRIESEYAESGTGDLEFATMIAQALHRIAKGDI